MGYLLNDSGGPLLDDKGNPVRTGTNVSRLIPDRLNDVFNVLD
jgi:hypothetical protein